MSDRPGLDALPALKPSSFQASVCRVVLWRHRNKILSTEGNRYFEGRYHRIGETGILYTSLQESTAVEEVKRHASPDQLSEGLVKGKIRIKLNRVLDLTQESVLKKLGLTEGDLIGADTIPTQTLSLQARRSGIQGLIVPSATGKGSNLIVFEDNLGEGCSIAIEEIQSV